MDPDAPEPVAATAMRSEQFRYFDFVMAAFVTILLLSNVIGAGKRAVIDLPFIGAWPFGAGILFFPVSYVIGDVLTEVYGYARARRCIWAGFGAMLLLVNLALPGEADAYGWGFLMRDPVRAALAAAALAYQPVFLDALPVFIWSMLALPLFARSARV